MGQRRVARVFIGGVQGRSAAAAVAREPPLGSTTGAAATLPAAPRPVVALAVRPPLLALVLHVFALDVVLALWFMTAGAPGCWWGCDVCCGGGGARLRAGDSCNYGRNYGLTPMTQVACLPILVVHSAVSLQKLLTILIRFLLRAFNTAGKSRRNCRRTRHLVRASRPVRTSPAAA